MVSDMYILGGLAGLTPYLNRLVLYYPLVSMINIFIHILENSRDSHIKADVVLMEVGLSHFGRTESVAPDLSLPFAREILRLARLTVEGSQREVQPIDSPLRMSQQSDHHTDISLDPPPSLFNSPVQSLDSEILAMVSGPKLSHYRFTG